MTALDALMDRPTKQGASTFEIREPANYDAFLTFHEHFGDYPNTDDGKAEALHRSQECHVCCNAEPSYGHCPIRLAVCKIMEY
jgi:hypothetical protein